MTAILLMASLLVGVDYKNDDFYYKGPDKLPHALAFNNKVLVDLAKTDKVEVLAYLKKEKASVADVKEINNTDWKSALVITFSEKSTALAAMNVMLEKFKYVYPIVVYDHIEVVVINEILFQVKEGVSSKEYLKRISKLTDGKYEVEATGGENIYALRILEPPTYPFNVLKLANLIAEDTFWIERARVAFLPLEGYITANISVETKAITNLGEQRTLKLVINVYTPDIVLKKDLLPKLGDNVVPSPHNATWFEIGPSRIVEKDHGMGHRTMTISHDFLYTIFGSYGFTPLTVTYEKNGKLQAINTNAVQFHIRSVIEGSDIKDIMYPKDQKQLKELNLELPLDKNQVQKLAYFYSSRVMLSVCLFVSLILVVPPVLVYMTDVIGTLSNPTVVKSRKLWRDLSDSVDIDFVNWREDYRDISNALNAVLVNEFGISLHCLSRNPGWPCGDSFLKLVNELEKMYMPDDMVPEIDVGVLRKSVAEFCKRRKYD